MNTETGVQHTWDAFEQFLFPRIYSTLFPLIVRKVGGDVIRIVGLLMFLLTTHLSFFQQHELDDLAVQTSLYRFRHAPTAQQLLLVGAEPAVAAQFAENAGCLAKLQHSADELATIASAKTCAEKLNVRAATRALCCCLLKLILGAS